LRKAIIIFILSFSIHAFSDSLSIFFLGDTYFGESYQTNPKYNGGINAIEKYGYDYFFENVKDLLRSSDHTILNLETTLYPLSTGAYLRKPYSHWSYGDKTCQYLIMYGIDAVSLGNNHVMDYGLPGYIETSNLLDKYNIKYFGAGDNSAMALLPLVQKCVIGSKILEIAVIGGFEYRKSYDSLYNFYANRELAGVNMFDTAGIISQVKLLREQNKDTYIVLFPHWGKNYKQVMDYQKEMAHALIDAGVDLIIGHGAHTVQESEYYNGKWIIYNIGNFIFNAPGRYSSTGAKPYGLMAELVITANSKKLRLYPIFTDNNKSGYQLSFLNEEEFVDCSRILGNNESINKLTGERNYFEIKLN
jgi:cyanophycin synthetase